MFLLFTIYLIVYCKKGVCHLVDTAPFYFQTRKEEIKSSYQYDILKKHLS